MFCPQCGTEAYDANFCSKCGKQIKPQNEIPSSLGKEKCVFCQSDINTEAVVCPQCHAKKGYLFRNKVFFEREDIVKLLNKESGNNNIAAVCMFGLGIFLFFIPIIGAMLGGIVIVTGGGILFYSMSTSSSKINEIPTVPSWYQQQN